jgi:uncharacterized protein YcgL (UPF0745 family)
MQCAIYKSNKKSDTYLFVEKEDKFDRVPPSLLDMLGDIELVMTLDLDKRDKLAQADLNDVKKSLAEQGYFLQLPPTAYISGSA